MSKAVEARHEQGNSGAARLRDDAAEIAKDVREMGGHLREAAAEQYGHLRDRASGYLERSRAKAREWEEGVEGYIREKPIRAVMIAAGVGVLVGLILRRR